MYKCAPMPRIIVNLSPHKLSLPRHLQASHMVNTVSDAAGRAALSLLEDEEEAKARGSAHTRAARAEGAEDEGSEGTGAAAGQTV